MRHAAWLLALCQIVVWVMAGIVISATWSPVDAQDHADLTSPLPATEPLPARERPAAAQSPHPAVRKEGTIRPDTLQRQATGVVAVEAYLSAPGAPAARRGCGVLVTRLGHVFAPLPVVRDAEVVVVTFSSGLRSPARRLATDQDNQLALLKALILPEAPVPLILSDRAYPASGQVLALLTPGDEIALTSGGRHVEGGPLRRADWGYAVPVPSGRSAGGGALLDEHGELVGLGLGAFSHAGPQTEERLLVLPVDEIRQSIDRILEGHSGTMLERLQDGSTA